MTINVRPFRENLSGSSIDLYPSQWFCLASGTYLMFAFGFSIWHEAPFNFYLLIAESMGITLTGLIFLFCSRVIFVMAFVRPTKLICEIQEDLRRYTTLKRIRFSFPVLISIPIFISAFGIFKAAIPFINPYSLDIKIAELDKLLHGGHHPWQLLQPIIGFPVITMVINVFYHLWFFVMISFLYWQACGIVNARLREQFLWSFLLIWMVLGTVCAIALSSVGPCYYGNFVGGDNPFAPLMEYLRSSNERLPIWALAVQDLLYTNYLDRHTSTALGISAMPSLHVATSVLMALVGWRICRSVGIALLLFAFIILVGSVHLGWHYALDGYVGAIGAFAIWHLVGWQLTRSCQSSNSQGNFTPPPPELAWFAETRLRDSH